MSRRDSNLRGSHAVERFTELEGSLGATLGHRIDDGANLRHHGVDVHATARQGRPQTGRRKVGAAQIDAGHDP